MRLRTSTRRAFWELFSTTSITKGAATRMRTSTTRRRREQRAGSEHRVASASGEQLRSPCPHSTNTLIKVWLYSIASFFSLAVLFATRHFSGGRHLQFMGESLGLVIVLLSCQICFHLNGVDEL